MNGQTDPAKPEPTEPTPEGPGGKHVGVFGITVTAVYLVAITLLALYAVVKLWPHTGSEPPVKAAPKTSTTTDTTGTTAKTGTSAKTGTPATTGTPAATGTPAPTETSATTGTQASTDTAPKQPPPKDPQPVDVFGGTVQLWMEERLLLLVLLGGAIGALLHAIRSMIAYVGNRNFVTSWLVFYYLSPVAGATLAFVAYIVLRGGLFSTNAPPENANAFMFVGLAALSGLFSQQVLEKLKKVAESAFEKTTSQKDALQTAKPVIDKLDPEKVAVNFEGDVKVTGSGFAAGSVVIAGGQQFKPSAVSDSQLTFKLPATLTAKPGKIDVVVQSPGPTGAKSDPPKSISVGP